MIAAMVPPWGMNLHHISGIHTNVTTIKLPSGQGRYSYRDSRKPGKMPTAVASVPFCGSQMFGLGEIGFLSTIDQLPLRSDCPSEVYPLSIAPILTRLGSCAGEGPSAKTFLINLKQISKPFDRSIGVGLQSGTAIEQMLRHVVGGISRERLGIDNQPRFAFRAKHVACM